eukprot:CAMPEP_0178452926 /NCGR_PEP_ID=MMETSP0689_2-20121128/44522_1 /TAXON_ID=160604 /ORGANISM="Amphidinium massartii, Strain CS-259" /LENGTH=181 /DNA_ID=CAMNT_0020078699 /DNA_START=136 /DNA_END=681 /DNA_ORIENTATION=-
MAFIPSSGMAWKRSRMTGGSIIAPKNSKSHTNETSSQKHTPIQASAVGIAAQPTPAVTAITDHKSTVLANALGSSPATQSTTAPPSKTPATGALPATAMNTVATSTGERRKTSTKNLLAQNCTAVMTKNKQLNPKQQAMNKPLRDKERSCLDKLLTNSCCCAQRLQVRGRQRLQRRTRQHE